MKLESIIIAAIGAIPSTIAAVYANKAHRMGKGNREIVEVDVKPKLDEIDKAVNNQPMLGPSLKEQVNDIHDEVVSKDNENANS